MEDREEVIDSIDDSLVRRLVRIAVHVRAYAPYYGATVALLVVLTLMPNADRGSDAATGAFAASEDAGAATTGVGRGGTRSLPSAAPGLSPAAADALVAGAGARSNGGPSASAVDLAVAGASGGSGAQLPSPPAAPAGADVPAFDPGDVDYGSDVPDACEVKPPSPAPSVAPSREVESLQGTAEAVAAVDLPVDASPYAEDAATAAGCPDVATLIPLPALPGLPI